MIFNLISDELIQNPFLSKHGKKVLYFPFAKAVEIEDADYFNEKINDITYWCNDVDAFVKNYLVNAYKDFTIKPVLSSDINFDFIIELDNELIALKDMSIYLIDKRISSYFNENKVFESQKIKLEILVKSIGILDFSLEDIFYKLKEYFGSDYKYYLPIVYKIAKEQKAIYDEELFYDIAYSKQYLENNRVYNIEGEFDLKRDAKGRYFQCEYTDSSTGRIFPRSQSLQTLPVEKRNILVAEPGCILLEYDMAYFEFRIIMDLLGLDSTKDPHQDVLNHLGLKLERKAGKKINYSYLYGMTPEKICEVVNEEFGVLVDVNLLKTYPLFLRKLKIDSYDGIIFSYFRRPVKITKDYAAFQNYVQATAADIFFNKFRQIQSILPSSGLNKIVLQNHDSILIQLEEKIYKETDISKDILNVLKSPIKLFTFDVEVKYGRKWSELN